MDLVLICAGTALVSIAAQVEVPPGSLREFTEVLHDLSQRLVQRGQRVWLFRNHDVPDLYLEFTEGADAATHRCVGPADAEEANLERRLRALGRYHPSAQQRWDGIPLDT